MQLSGAGVPWSWHTVVRRGVFLRRSVVITSTAIGRPGLRAMNVVEETSSADVTLEVFHVYVRA
jgi:hypothetical protein